MNTGKIKLRYLKKFTEELNDAVMYIEEKLNNPTAADNLLKAVETAITQRSENADSFEPFHSQKERRYPYYRIYVGNFIVYYVVIDDEGSEKVMEVRRFLYQGRDRTRII